MSNNHNLSQTAAIDVLFSINFAVVFDLIYFRFRPSEAKWIGNVLPNRQNAVNYFQRFFFWINLMCSHPHWFWGRDTLAFGRGCGGVPIPTRGQTLLYSRYVCTSPLWMNRCVNTKDGTLLSALLYWLNDAPCAIRQCATILQRLWFPVSISLAFFTVRRALPKSADWLGASIGNAQHKGQKLT